MLYYVFKGLEFILMLLPFAVRKLFFTALASMAYAIDRKHRDVIRRNLEIAYGKDVDEAKVRKVARYCYRNLMLNFLQVLENQRMTKARQAELVRFENRDVVDRARAAGRPVIFISGHFGNWELGATSIALQIMPTVSIHKQLNNPYFDRYLLASRSRLGMHMTEKHGAVKHLARALKKGEAVSLMIDQNINIKDGMYVDFFGQKATQTTAPAFLARKYNAAVIPVFIHTQDEKRHVVRFEDELVVPKTENAEEDIRIATQQQSDVVERIIKAEPEFWFWCHRRWKDGRPGIYD
jgi:Kdo2-lipid IVA lauroyltransferase/acyltransferase